jgi:hypothetical protein
MTCLLSHLVATSNKTHRLFLSSQVFSPRDGCHPCSPWRVGTLLGKKSNDMEDKTVRRLWACALLHRDAPWQLLSTLLCFRRVPRVLADLDASSFTWTHIRGKAESRSRSSISINPSWICCRSTFSHGVNRFFKTLVSLSVGRERRRKVGNYVWSQSHW